MELGAFSISLAVKDLAASQRFYEALGFRAFGGDAAQGWLIMKNGAALIGLFQGMFEGHMLTFNPGWDSDGPGQAGPTPGFVDVRDIQRHLMAHGIQPEQPTDEQAMGPASFTVLDPDGNRILIDQHL